MTRHNRDGAGSPRRYELGDTDDPARLVPGRPRDLHDYAGELREDSANHRVIATTLREIPVGQMWAGEAADEFIGTAVALVRRYDDAADAHRLAARTVEGYADGLAQAQRKAGEAIDLYGSTANQPRGDRDATRTSGQTGADPQIRRDDARRLLDRARADLAALAQDAHVQIRRARDTLPSAAPLLTDGGGSPHTAPASTAPAASDGIPTPPPGGRTITVRRGDTLSGIAERFLGDASRWPEIAELNSTVIKDPDLIYPGQRLVLPAPDDERRDRDPDDDPGADRDDREDSGSPESDRCDPPRADGPDDDRPHDDRPDDDRSPRDSQDDDRYPDPPAPPDPAPRGPDRPPDRPEAPPPTSPPSTPAPAPTPTPTPAPTPAPAPAPAPGSPDGSATPAPPSQPAPTSPQPTPAPSPEPLPDFYPEPAPREPDIYDLPDAPPPTSNERVPDQPAPPPEDPEPPPSTTGPTTPPPLHPPTTETAPAPAPPAPPTTGPGTPTTPDGADPNSGAPTPDTPDPPEPPEPRSSPSLVANDGEPDAIDLGTGLFVVGAVGAVAAGAVLLARRSGTAANRPAVGTGTGTNVGGRRSPLPPVVRQLGDAYLRARRPDTARSTAAATSPPPPAGAPAPPARRIRFALPIGRTTDGGAAHIDLATHPALALHGDRVPDITRAILLACLSPPTDQPTTGPPAHVVIPAADAAHLLDDLPTLPTPPGLHIVDDLDAAIDQLERWPHASPPVVLIATAPRQPDPAERLHQILTTRRRRVGAVLLGEWPTPATIHATRDAAIHGNTSYPTLPIGTRLFTTSLPDARDLLAALASPHPRNDLPDETGPGDPPTTPILVVGADEVDEHDAGGDPDLVDREPDRPVTATTSASTNTAAAHPANPGQTSTTSNAYKDFPADEAGDLEDDETDSALHPTGPTEPGKDTSGRKALTIEVFGRLRVYVTADGPSSADIAGDLSGRRRELLTYLAVHPAGARRDLIINDLWADSNARSPADNLHSAIHRLRTAFAEHVNDAPIILGPEDDHYQLNPTQVDVDYWRFEAAAARHHTAGTDAERAEAAHRIIRLYKDDLASALTAAWIEPFRAQTHRVAIDASDSLARHLYRSGDTDQAIGLLEHAITAIAPHAESLYQLLIQLQRKQGRPKAAERTLETLTTRLADLELQPSAATVALVRSPPASSTT